MSVSVATKSAFSIEAYELPRWFRPVLRGLVIEVFLLIVLGGAVRIMNAGLACPDWPLCFGNYIPDYHPQVYFEFIHRAMAGLVAISTAGLAIILWMSQAPRNLKALMAGAVILLLAQIVFGGLTVLLQLQAGVVATHLAMGTAFFAVLLWIYLETGLTGPPKVSPVGAVKWLPRYLLVVIYAQVILGGLVASHYAGLVCLDFPKCQGQWFPTFEGMIGLHIIHRLGAYFVFLSVLISWLVLRKRKDCPRTIQRLSLGLFHGVATQIGLGVANVFLRTPPLVGVAHLALATLLLSFAVRMVHASRVENPVAAPGVLS